nr:hypothetical protein CFP56_50462 [Quercus suber]POE49550.1 hypothetical protein CFP56_50467 [Quercus suber]
MLGRTVTPAYHDPHNSAERRTRDMRTDSHDLIRVGYIDERCADGNAAMGLSIVLMDDLITQESAAS